MHDHGDRGAPARPPRRRWRRPRLAAFAGTLALTLAVAACGGGGKSNGVASLGGSGQPTSTTSANSSKDFKQAALAFAKCMRQHGIDMPDPQVSGNAIMQKGPTGVKPDDPKFKAAQQACNKLLPNGGQPSKPNPQEQQQMLKFARCMRQHGIDMPDPGPNGGIEINGGPSTVKPDDPKFKAAQQACQQYQPKGGKLQTSGGGGK